MRKANPIILDGLAYGKARVPVPEIMGRRAVSRLNARAIAEP